MNNDLDLPLLKAADTGDTTLLTVLVLFKVSNYSYSCSPVLQRLHPEKEQRECICRALSPLLQSDNLSTLLHYQIPQTTTYLSYQVKKDAFTFTKIGCKIKPVLTI